MTPQLQLFMVLGALMLLCIIFTLLKRGLMSVKYSLLWLCWRWRWSLRRRSPT